MMQVVKQGSIKRDGLAQRHVSTAEALDASCRAVWAPMHLRSVGAPWMPCGAVPCTTYNQSQVVSQVAHTRARTDGPLLSLALAPGQRREM